MLIHAASGGVGLASLQLAKTLGASTVATAGTASKRSLLRVCGHSVVTNSRALTFIDDCIMVRPCIADSSSLLGCALGALHLRVHSVNGMPTVPPKLVANQRAVRCGSYA